MGLVGDIDEDEDELGFCSNTSETRFLFLPLPQSSSITFGKSQTFHLLVVLENYLMLIPTRPRVILVGDTREGTALQKSGE